MSDDKDAPVNLPLYKRFWNKIQASMGFSVFCVVLLVSLIALGLIGNYWHEDWEAEQWGPVASWVASLATFLAVGVALYQTKLARDDAAQAKLDAAEQQRIEADRHSKELEAADERLSNELKASRDFEQLQTIPPIWQEIADLAESFTRFKRTIVKAHQIQPTTTAVEAFKEEVMPFINGLKNLELVFTPALIMVTERHTENAVKKLYKDTRDLLRMCEGAIKTGARDKKLVDTNEMTEQMSKISKSRKPMINIARQHLNGAPPLDFDNLFDEEEANETTDTEAKT
ncbi:hypothetical protein [Rhodococcus sp. IEGM 1374]|uniref:hypothetical protein n=1 Tax=Rhodococcus sp. IEGM 1374 TaxID=3082221 RepID=UPI0029540D70|nr:hypothetical protein [Rhodococcus sp. IEGM 1374]MDV7992089.1 hypothetical protein [Rhodococcus sp. IEGM 1374]